jgi:hypothetical protein
MRAICTAHPILLDFFTLIILQSIIFAFKKHERFVFTINVLCK